jgi:hypothetical protein
VAGSAFYAVARPTNLSGFPKSARFEDCTVTSPTTLLWAGAAVSFLSLTASAFGQQETLGRHAAIGQTVRLGGHVNYTHNCSDTIPTAISVVQAPRHGTLEVRDEVVRSGHPELGHGSKCAGASGMGKVVNYTRTSQGADVFTYDSVSANGVVHVHVTVQ